MSKAGIVITAVAVVLVATFGLGARAIFKLGMEAVQSRVTREQFDAQQIGTPEAQVRAALPRPLKGLDDLAGDNPGEIGIPADASCAYYTVGSGEPGGPDAWRFCFVDGALVEKSAIRMGGGRLSPMPLD